MKKNILFFTILVLMSAVFLSSIEAGEFRSPLGLTYISGFQDVYDVYKDNLESQGFEVQQQYFVPVGISFQPYYQFDNGLRLGAGFGPAMLILIANDSDSTDTNRTFFSLPVNLSVGYTFFPTASISPYVRSGVSYPFASGDYVKSSSAGLLGAVGIEFLRKKRVSIGLELAYDTSEITMETHEWEGAWYNYEGYYYDYDYYSIVLVESTKKIKSQNMMISIFAVF